MKTSTSELELRVDNFSYTLTEIISQISGLKAADPNSFFYKGQGDYENFDPQGFVERVKLRLEASFNHPNPEERVDRIPNSLIMVSNYFDHNEILSLLNETLTKVSQQRFSSMDELRLLYRSLMDRLEEIRVKQTMD
jgi:hypothetical protein